MLLELRDCDPYRLDDLAYIRRELLRAAGAVGAQVVGESFHQFTPQGVTGILSIAESHISIHTWPELGYAAADIFTCGEQTMPDRAADVIIAALGCRNPENYANPARAQRHPHCATAGGAQPRLTRRARNGRRQKDAPDFGRDRIVRTGSPGRKPRRSSHHRLRTGSHRGQLSDGRNHRQVGD